MSQGVALINCLPKTAWPPTFSSAIPLIPFEATARGYFAKLAAGAPVSPAVMAAYDNEESRRTLAGIQALASDKGCSVQAAAILAAADAPFQVVPLTSARHMEQMTAILEALSLLR